MADTVKLPVIGPTDRRWVWAGGALIAGIVGYAWWNRSRTGAPAAEVLPEDIPQDREPPPTVVGETSYDTGEVRAIINTNPEWYTAAIDYLVSTGGFDFTFAAVTLGKFLARRSLTEQEANLVQAAKGAVGEPPQGGPWPIIRSGPAGPSTAPSGAVTTRWQGSRLAADTTWIALARKHARHPTMPDSVAQTKLNMFSRNPTIVARIGTRNNAVLKRGWIVVIPVHKTAAV